MKYLFGLNPEGTHKNSPGPVLRTSLFFRQSDKTIRGKEKFKKVFGSYLKAALKN